MKRKKSISSPQILTAVLKAYIENPKLFLIKAKLTFGRFKRTITKEFPKEFIETTGLVAWMYIRLHRRIGKEKAFEIIRSAVITIGFALQQYQFIKIGEKRTFKNLVKNHDANLKRGTAKLNTLELIEHSEKRYEFRVTRCLFMELFTHVGVPELTTIYCSVDNAIFNSYLPERITFHRNGINNTMIRGADYCEFVIENNEYRRSHDAMHDI